MLIFGTPMGETHVADQPRIGMQFVIFRGKYLHRNMEEVH